MFSNVHKFCSRVEFDIIVIRSYLVLIITRQKPSLKCQIYSPTGTGEGWVQVTAISSLFPTLLTADKMNLYSSPLFSKYIKTGGFL